MKKISDVNIDGDFGKLIYQAKQINDINKFFTKELPKDLADKISLTHLDKDIATIESVSFYAYNIRFMQTKLLILLNKYFKYPKIKKIKIVIKPI